eukprot:279805_1
MMGCIQSTKETDLIDLIQINKRVDQKCTNGLNCQQLIRLRDILQYYHTWLSNGVDNDQSNGIFEYVNEYNNNTYTLFGLLNDYLHLGKQHVHSEKFQEISDFFGISSAHCDFETCIMFKRNNRNRNKNSSNSTLYYKSSDGNEVATQQTLDQIHTYIYHAFDFVVKQNQLMTLENNDDDRKYDDRKYDDRKYDDIFSDGITNNLAPRKSKGTNELRKLLSQRVQSHVNRFMTVISENDTNNSENPLYLVQFSFGVRYYYDARKYKHNNEIDITYNVGDRYNEWYVATKYRSLKDELLNNNTKRIDLSQYNEVLNKSKQYIQTDHTKYNSPNIKVENIICICIYCNFDEFQKACTVTVRFINENETN